MSVLPDLSIRSRLSLAFGIAFALTIVLGAFELSQLRAVNRVAVDVRDTWLPRVELLGELKRAVSQHRSLALRQLQTTNFRYLLEIATTTSATADAIDAASADYARVIRLPAERQLLERFVEQWARYREINARLLEYLQVGDVTTAFSEFDQSKAAFQAATARLDDLVAFAKERSQQQVERAQSIYERAWYLTLAAVVACALCTGLTAVWTGGR